MATAPRASAKSAIKAQIDENLKKVYQAALDEEVPDRFKDLLAKLAEKKDSAK